MDQLASEIHSPIFVNPRTQRKEPYYEPPADYVAFRERFDRRTAMPETDPFEDDDYFDYCRPWLGRPTNNQFFFYVRGVKIPIHRFAFRLRLGDIPDTHVARPICGMTKCVNPRHLILRPRSEGGKPGQMNTVLDRKAIDDIYWLFHDELTPFSAASLAKLFCVSTQRVYQIAEGRKR